MTGPAVPLRGLAPEQALRRLELVITRRIDGLLQGDHLGLVPGQGSEPADARDYQPGDDVRRMDWNVTARTAIPHVRDPVADRELETHVLVDASASMDFGTGLVEKRDLAAAATAAVGFLTSRAGNRIGAQIEHARGVRRVPARTGREHVLSLLRVLLGLPRTEPGTPPRGLAPALEELRRTVRRRGLVVVVSDFLEPPAGPAAGWERSLRRLAATRQVLAVEVVDPRDLSLPDVGILTLVDPESGRRREVATGDPRVRRRYADAAERQRAAVATGIRRAGADHLRLRTDRDRVADIVRHVLARRRLARRGAAPTVPAAAPPGGGAR